MAYKAPKASTPSPWPAAGKNGTDGSGGHTSHGAPYRKPGNSTPAGSEMNARIGTLGTRTQGMGRDKRK